VIHESTAARLDLSRIPGKVVRLCDRAVADDEEAAGMLHKYQPLNQFFAKLATMFAEDGAAADAPDRRCRVIAVYSASGGAGKTTVALTLAQLMALKHRRVFLLNLELFSTLPAFFAGGDDDRFARLIYYARTQPDRLAAKIEHLKSYDSATKLSYFEKPGNIQELMEMTAADVVRIVDCLVRSTAYDAIVIDLESTLHERIAGALAACDRLIWLFVDDGPCISKSLAAMDELKKREARGQLRITPKTRFVVNKFTGSLSRSFGRFGDIHGYLPYIPEWKHAVQGEQLPASPFFAEKLMQLAADIWVERGDAELASIRARAGTEK
jgi:cellulose biosynthesis protein BcsQ